MFNLPQPRPFWSKDLEKSINEIQKLDDPNTSADEMLSASKWSIYALLAYSGILGAMSYYKNFEPSFGHQAALLMCLCLVITIEVGKNYFGVWSVRILMIAGIKHSCSEVHHFVKLVSLVGFATATFSMSVINSTRGGEQLSQLLRQEKNGMQLFKPNTDDIDAQIAQINNQIETNNKNTWKGMVVLESQRANKSLSRSIESLNKQKEAAASQQRDDWNKYYAQTAENSNYAAKLVMASGGWVEILQFILLLFRVSCEKTLLKRKEATTPTPSPQQFRNMNGNGTGSTAGSNQASTFKNNAIGFDYPNKDLRTSFEAQNLVSQCDTAVEDVKRPDQIEAAFKHYLTKFKADVSNLLSKNGQQATVCGRLRDALHGMLSNIPEDAGIKDKAREYLVWFNDNVHVPMLNRYTVDIEQTPLKLYKKPLDELCLKITSNNYESTRKV